MREIESGCSFSKAKDKHKKGGKAYHNNWRQMQTPHPMNDLTQASHKDYNSKEVNSRPSQSPGLKIMATE